MLRDVNSIKEMQTETSVSHFLLISIEYFQKVYDIEGK